MVKTSSMKYGLLYFLLCIYGFGYAQTSDVTPESSEYDEVKSLVSFYSYMLNNIGSPKTSTRDKDVMIKESYKKVFLNDQVQIEDDLIADRQVITNKEISSYLKDVDFFFEEIAFEFDQIEIKKVEKENGSFFFLVSFENSIKGITIENEEYTSIKKRFIEVNLNEETNDLKIVSVYSTKVSREKELATWWSKLSYGWTSIFKSHLQFNEISSSILLKIADMDSLDLSNNQNIIDIEPLAVLKNLQVVNLSNTQISDIGPLRYSRRLQKLDISNTPVSDIEALHYFDKLTTLLISQSNVIDIRVLPQLTSLSTLDLSNTQILNFDPLNSLTLLRDLDLSNTEIRDTKYLFSSILLESLDLSNTQINELSVCNKLNSLKELDVSNSNLTTLGGLENHPSLTVLSINGTQISALDPLLNVTNLKKVSADLTNVSELVASEFMNQNTGALVITNSKETMNWWYNLSDNWQQALTPIIANSSPNQDDIIRLLNMDSLNLSDKYLQNSTPLEKFKSLKYLDISKNQFSSIDFTADMEHLQYLNITDSHVKSTQGLEKNLSLQYLILNNTNLEDIVSLSRLSNLKLLEANQTLITDYEVKSHLEQNPNTVIIYQSEKLKNWWSSLSSEWKQALQIENYDNHEIHRLVEQREVSISGASITSVTAIDVFINLERISLDRVAINNIQELTIHENLRELSCTNSPLQTLEGIIQFSELELLDISNTAVEDLKSISTMTTLKHLNCSGTGVKNIRSIARIYGLESLDISNTGVWRLDWLYKMTRLTNLVCNNTRLSQQKVDDFKFVLPDCEVTYY